MFIDTHAHLNDAQFEADREAVLRRASDCHITHLIEIADSPADWQKAIDLSRARPQQVRCALGLHPYYADQWREELGVALVEQANSPEVVAVGEIGLDYAKCAIPPEIQKKALAGMLKASCDTGLPVVLHCREAYADLLPILKKFYAAQPLRGRFRGVVHCFSGNQEDALAATYLGFALGVDGPITYPKNDALRSAIYAAGLDYIVLETDSPYLPPQSSRGKRNEPATIAEIAASVARLFQTTTEQVAQRTSQNARDLFRI